ncbi:hypothetical protein CASFOL_003821 [Castilleja foliolosa]|uniref:Uncharacterized protein n=1 Tax=Castilleja foliolosa TaxID=1961234 RepID=A0ABD3EIN0_9LAMI
MRFGRSRTSNRFLFQNPIRMNYFVIILILQDEVGNEAIKTVELDFMPGCVVQYKELQG